MNKTGLYIDSKNNRAYWNGDHVHFAKSEFRFLELCYIWRGRRVAIDRLMDYIYHDKADEPFQTILNRMAFMIREKLPGIRLYGQRSRRGSSGFTLE